MAITSEGRHWVWHGKGKGMILRDAKNRHLAFLEFGPDNKWRYQLLGTLGDRVVCEISDILAIMREIEIKCPDFVEWKLSKDKTTELKKIIKKAVQLRNKDLGWG